MNIMRSCAVAAIAFALVPAAFADVRRDTIYINPFAAYQYFDDKRELSESDVYGVGIEYRFTDRWALEGVYSRGDIDRKNAPGDSEFDELRLDATYYFADPDQAFNPYVSFGGGHADFGDDPTGPRTSGSNHDETRVNIGAGFRYNVSDMISLRGDLREFHGIDESTFDTQIALSFSLAFVRNVVEEVADRDRDGIPDDRDACPDSTLAAEVDSQGCEFDGDNDGVVDGVDQCPSTLPGAEVDEKGCSGIVETIETIEVDVQFAFDSDEIDSVYKDHLERIGEIMRENPETFVEVAGHTDDSGDSAYNQDLSQRRAEAVAARLIEESGIEEYRVSATGYGAQRPVASNDTQEGRAANRRVEALIQLRR
ncbi:OmpA family protein [Marinobacter sp. F4216]|uniref:OmpA family protein n=1 Tax=Marinobacter sp. F4216 TaxID=2874281 RepID=UPI001CBEA3A1|nr:OmpA family protein [Marinobacter sp. F4216]MBZ2169308.1 OmpA family protein [Marinobacter sp. F4216]